jgi:anti-sigma regulatory factor (Ser/Thr protein kinase)
LLAGMKDTISLACDRAGLARLLAFAVEFARGCDLIDDERSRLLIILDELFTNALMHGYEPDAGSGEVTVGLECKQGSLAIDFTDDGRAFDPLAVTEPDFETMQRERTVGSLGLHIVRSLADEARYWREDGRNHLRLVRVRPLSAAGDTVKTGQS